MFVDAAPVLGGEANLTVFVSCQRGLGQRLHAHEPLVGDPRLDDGPAAVTATDGVMVGLYSIQQVQLLESLNDRLASGYAVEAAEVLRHFIAQRRIRIEDVDLRQVVAAPDLEVIRVVSRGHLDDARPEFRVHELIGDDGYLSLGQRKGDARL